MKKFHLKEPTIFSWQVNKAASTSRARKMQDRNAIEICCYFSLCC